MADPADVGSREQSKGRAVGAKSSRDRGTAALEPDLSLASWHDADRLFCAVREALVPVGQPIALISQIQRSGGSLLSALLDGHPELHSHPHELQIGHPKHHNWPLLDPGAGTERWLELLREGFVRQLFADGYWKLMATDDSGKHPTLPFVLPPSFLDRLFRLLCTESPPRTSRQVIDHYLTAFFNAWIDCQGLRDGPKKWVTAFAPRLAWGENRRRFLADYPDGRLIAVHRDPRGWYASASTYTARYGEGREALAHWRNGAEEILAAKHEHPHLTFVLTYESLVTEPERTLRGLADWLEIGWAPMLLQPTFNRQPVRANSSFPSSGTGIRTESVDRWRDVLSAEIRAVVDADTQELDRAVREIADQA